MKRSIAAVVFGLFTVAASGAGVRATTGAAGSGARTVQEALDSELSRARAS